MINVIEWRSPCHFETAIIKDFFSLINFTSVSQKWENKSAHIELAIRSEKIKV